MYVPKDLRERVRRKYGGRCAYSGTVLKTDWQVDHYYPVRYCNTVLPNVLPKITEKAITNPNVFHNLMPAQRIINHYKRALTPERFKNWFLGGLHKRLQKLPKNPKVQKSIRHKQYLLEVAMLFDITEDKPFSGVFYFETLTFKRTS